LNLKTDIMIYTVIILIVVVQIIQALGNLLYRKMINEYNANVIHNF